MATSWDLIKTILPNGNEVAYIFQLYTNVNGQCTPNPLNVSMQCSYLAGVAANTGLNNNDSWSTGMPLEGIFPTVGEFVSINITQPSGNQYAQCYKCVEIVDKNTFLTGTCTSCYNAGYGGACSDAFITVPPYPGDQNGCRYDNSINAQGIVVGYFSGLNSATFGGSWVTYISPNCVDCTTPSPPPPPPTSTLNFIQNCCDATERYQFSPTSSIYTTLINLGAVAPNAFRADLYIGGAQTGMKCWSVGTHLNPQLVPFAYGITMDPPDLWQTCLLLQNYMHNDPNYPDCCNYEPCDPLNPWSPLVNQWHIPAVVDQFCQECVTLGSVNYNHQDCVCCSGGTQCDPPVAALINLQAKVKGFSDRRIKALSEPKVDRAQEKAFEATLPRQRYTQVEFHLSDLEAGTLNAQRSGFKGTLTDVQNAAARLFNDDGTINETQKGILACKKCGGGFGICGKGSCIGAKCCPPLITIKIPLGIIGPSGGGVGSTGTVSVASTTTTTTTSTGSGGMASGGGGGGGY